MKTNNEYLKELKTSIIREMSEVAELLLYVSIEEDKNTDALAYTDGNKICFGKDFFTLNISEQTFVLLHEIFHIALLHIPRFENIKNTYGKEYGLWWNIATDAIINETLIALGIALEENNNKKNILAMPKKGITKKTIFRIIGEKQDTNKAYDSAEELFMLLMSHYDDIKNSQRGKEYEKGEKTLGNQKDLEEPSESLTDEEIEEGGNDVVSAEVKREVWKGRIDRMSAAINNSKLSRILENSFPTPKINWRKALKQLVSLSITNCTIKSWRRPSRRFLSGVVDFVEPGIVKEKTIDTVAIVFDRSGSCDDENIIYSFLAEMNSIQRIFKCKLVVIQHEVLVSSVDTISYEENKDLLAKHKEGKFNIQGGGGTSFDDALNCAATYNPVVTIAFTDGYGHFPEVNPLKSKLIWAILPGGLEKEHFPYGFYIELIN